jgi:hypothetical protein
MQDSKLRILSNVPWELKEMGHTFEVGGTYLPIQGALHPAKTRAEEGATR